jgi:hypothetical protein
LKNEFLYFAKLYPKARYLLKHMDQGEVKMVDFDDINFMMGHSR